jgi:two-component system NtrC family response regulator
MVVACDSAMREELGHRVPERRVAVRLRPRGVFRVLGRADGNLRKVAVLLGISRPTLYDLLYRVGLK